ncbi:MAG: hypothetical protein ACFE8A_13335 [Candidatus Hodarchaeota archaeon]
MIQIIVNLHNYLVDFCKKYSKEYGDCYKCPIGQQIKEFCKIEGAIRFLDKIIRNYKPLTKSELKKVSNALGKDVINILDTQFRKGDLMNISNLKKKERKRSYRRK